MQEELTSKAPFDELLKVSAQRGVDVKKLDFKILSFTTFYTINDSEPKELSEKELGYFDEDKNFLEAGLNISQSFKISIFEKTDTSLEQRVKLILNKDESALIADINLKGLNFEASLPLHLLQFIYRQMIKERLFIGLRSFDFKQKLIDFLNAFKKGQKSHAKILVSRGVKPISPANESLILDYELRARQSLSQMQKISFIGIKQNELAITHIKGAEGRAGKSLRLKHIDFRLPKDEKIEFSCSNNFESKETSANESFVKTQYFALKNGFIAQENNNFDIQNELNLNSVNFKEVGAIACGLDTGVSINVRNTSELEEAVGSGVNIECETLTINGTVAGNTLLKAKNFKLYGTSNPKTKIIAQSAYISTHKGILECENADIDSLESGTLKAKIAVIKKALGGSIKANSVQILNLVSNNQISFNSICLIEQCSGSNNKFLVYAFKDDEDLQAKLEALELRQKELPKLLAALEQSVSSSKSGVLMLVKKANELKAQGLSVPANFSSLIQNYQRKSEELSALYKEQSELEIAQKELENTLKSDEEELFNAKLINKSGLWSEMNEVRFRLLFPKKELVYASKAEDKNKVFSLKKDFDNAGEISIQKTNDYDEKDIQCFTPSKA